MRTYAIFSPAGPRSILKTVPATGPSASPVGSRQQLRDPASRALDARAGDRRAEEHRMHERPLRLRRELLAQPVVWDAVSSSTTPLGWPRRLCDSLDKTERRRKDGRGVPAAHFPSGRSRRSAAPRSPVGRARQSAPRRSTLFTKMQRGDPQPLQRAHQQRVCDCTPSTAETTSTAPSSTLSTRSTSAMKSG